MSKYDFIDYMGNYGILAVLILLRYVYLCQLRDGSYHQGTVTSMEPNEGTFALHSETAKVISLNLVCLTI